MVQVIHSVKKFCDELMMVSDMFWYMVSLRGEPREVIGPCTLYVTYAMSRLHHGSLQVLYGYMSGEQEIIEEKRVADLVNEYAGVFLNEADAYEYLEARKAAYASDPQFIARTMRGHEEESARGLTDCGVE